MARQPKPAALALDAPAAPKTFADGVPTDIGAGGEYRLIVRQIQDLNTKFDNLAKPPGFRVADVVTLAGSIIALAVFIVTAFALSDRINQAELRVTKTQERIADDLSAVRDDMSDLKSSVAVLEEKAK